MESWGRRNKEHIMVGRDIPAQEQQTQKLVRVVGSPLKEEKEHYYGNQVPNFRGTLA
jgi:hypothetical protein